MKSLGLIGGIGSGKSTVAGMLCRRGAEVIDADQIGHDVLFLPEVKAAARTRWGDGVFGDDGELDRRRLAAIVFQKTPESLRELEFLKTLTHPPIGRELERRKIEYEESGVPVLVLDVPLLLEAGWGDKVNRLVFVDASKELRAERARQRGWTREEFEARESAQLPVEEKRKWADWVVCNNGNLDKTLDQTGLIWQNLVGV